MKWVAFLRGINVGGHRKVPMADLRRICADAVAARNVQTYIASGNVMFEAEGPSERLSRAIQEGIKDTFGFDAPTLVLGADAMRGILADYPFQADAGKGAYAYLCYDTPQLDHAGIAALKAPSEEVADIGKTVWLYAPNGIGRSKLAAKMERLVGVDTTARNLNTIRKMVDLLDEAAP